MSKNKKNKKMSLDDTMPLESHDSAAEKMPSNEAKEVSKQPKKSFGRKV